MSADDRWGRALIGQILGGVAACLAASIIWLAARPQYFWPRWVWFGVGLVIAVQYALRWALTRPPGRRRAFAIQAALTAVYMVMDLNIWALSGGGFFWPVFSLPVVAIALAAHAWWLQRVPPTREQELVKRVDTLHRTRSGALDVQAAELRRIERDLHDGAQARMVSLAMNLGLASELLKRDPAAVAALLIEARETTLSALGELRTVMEGIQPPVLADRGLVGAVESLALDLAIPVTVTADVPGELEAPLESAIYFAIAEALANIVKHSRATAGSVNLGHHSDRLTVRVSDNGIGGAEPISGSGLGGIASRLEVFDGTLTLSSPSGGPTELTMEVPCALSSPKTSPSFGTA